MKLPFHLLGFVGPLSEKRGDRHGRSSNAQEASPSRSRGCSSSRSFSGDNRLLLFFEGDSRQRGSRPASTIIWLKEFQKFDDNSSAINVGNGVNKQLTDMIMQWRRPGQKLVVGKPEYKSTIETFLGIPCLHDEVVMEVMWGMQRFMSNFVPAEESKLPKEDSLPMSQGLLMALLDVGHYLKHVFRRRAIKVAGCMMQINTKILYMHEIALDSMKTSWLPIMSGLLKRMNWPCWLRELMQMKPNKRGLSLQ
uniref:Uncharacterized protein n=1 Tax=Oryza barthii TaxID=65489 RepID=A0A0D3HNC6_9ORYZ